MSLKKLKPNSTAIAFDAESYKTVQANVFLPNIGGNKVDLLEKAGFEPGTEATFSDFVLGPVDAIINGKKTSVDIYHMIEGAGRFSFDVPCGTNDWGKEIVDTVSGSLNLETGIITISSIRCNCLNNKVYCVEVSGNISATYQYKTSDLVPKKEVQKMTDLASKEGRCGFEYRGYCNAKTEEDCADISYCGKCLVDLISLEELDGINKRWKKEAENDPNKPMPKNQRVKDVIDIEGTKTVEAEAFILDGSDYVVDLLKKARYRVAPYASDVGFDNFVIGPANVVTDSKNNKSHADTQTCSPDENGNFSFDVDCGTDDDGNAITDTVHGNLNKANGILTISTTRGNVRDNRVYSVNFSGTITIEPNTMRVGLAIF